MNKFEIMKKVIIIILVTIIISVTLISFQKQTQNIVKSQDRYIVYDKSFISVMNNISKDIHGNVETSAFSPYIIYFASRSYRVETPYGIESDDELVKVMKKINCTYLLVFENVSDEEKLKYLFSEKIQDLDKDFQNTNNYSTDYYKIRLYKIKGD